MMEEIKKIVEEKDAKINAIALKTFSIFMLVLGFITSENEGEEILFRILKDLVHDFSQKYTEGEIIAGIKEGCRMLRVKPIPSKIIIELIKQEKEGK